MTDDPDDELDRLRRRTETGSRIEEAPTQEARRELRDAIRAELAAIEEGERQKTVSVWDGPVAALIAALEDRPDDLERVGERLQAALDTDAGQIDRSELLRLALRLGFREGAPEAMDALRDAVREHSVEDL